MKIVDLRSDTVIQPTPPMREAMMRAELGDDVFGDDPTVNALQERIGSALVGSGGFIRQAHRYRKMLGGGMRQASVLAGAALYALDHHVTRLADDHAPAQRLADGLQGMAGLTVEAPQTNKVFVDVEGERAKTLLPHLKSRGVLATGLYRLRFETHLDVDASDIDRAIVAVRDHFNA